MSRNASAVLFDLPLYDLDEIIAKIDAVTIDDVAELAAELYAPSGSPPPASAPTRAASAAAAGRGARAARVA